ncbi:MAG: DUF1269 domain-containing protein [Chloroflexales bacterium]|nr:DUF1269 domain-containing protein [Chloroflexales bacterium]
MATLTVLKFDSPTGAESMLGTLESLQKQELIKILDAAIVTWPMGKKKPKTRQLHNMAGLSAFQGAFWGMLFGLIFFIPFLGMAIGAGMGALMGAFVDVGIDDKFIKQTQSAVTEGTSALFLLSASAVQDRLATALKGIPFEIISTNLSKEQEDRLRAAFGEEE